LIITFMFEPAKLQMNCASASGRIRRRADMAGRAVPSAWSTAMGFSVTPGAMVRDQATSTLTG
jgi:hypothetical protein